ncbi:unnamed protein product [Auanema sp. JU1783]|nr:unnamed protein product [Auanema sp. JU1783]
MDFIISFLTDPEDPDGIRGWLLTLYPGSKIIKVTFTLLCGEESYPGSKIIKVTFTLLCGEESYKSFTIDVASEITYDGLKDYLSWKCKCFPSRYQQIYFRGEELPVVEHPLRSVEDGEELSILTDIEFSSNSFFSTLYSDDAEYPTLKIKWRLEQRPFRSLRGEDTKTCDVYRGETLLKTYYVRAHMYPRQQRHNRNADLRVLFMYKLLEILRLGPKVHFYRNRGQSGFGLYTASEEVPGFQNHLNRGSYGSLTHYKVKLFSICFYLRDVMNRRENYGVDINGRPQIVNFRVTSNVHSAKFLADRYCGNYQEQETKIGKACFSEWNLLSCIDMADKAIEKEKKLFEDHSFTFEPVRDYAEYLTKIKINVRYFTALFDRLEPPLSLVACCLRSVDPDQINFPLRHYRLVHCCGPLKRFFRPK